MKLLVTGGAGYVGATVARLARHAGHQVVVVDDLARNDERQIPTGVMFTRLRVHDIAEVLTPPQPVSTPSCISPVSSPPVSR